MSTSFFFYNNWHIILQIWNVLQNISKRKFVCNKISDTAHIVILFKKKKKTCEVNNKVSKVSRIVL